MIKRLQSFWVCLRKTSEGMHPYQTSDRFSCFCHCKGESVWLWARTEQELVLRNKKWLPSFRRVNVQRGQENQTFKLSMSSFHISYIHCIHQKICFIMICFVSGYEMTKIRWWTSSDSVSSSHPVIWRQEKGGKVSGEKQPVIERDRTWFVQTGRTVHPVCPWRHL